MPQAPSLLINAASRHQVYLEGHKTHIANEFTPFLKKMAKIVNTKLAVKDITEFNRERLEKTIKNINDDISDVYRSHYKIWREQVVDLAEYEAGFEVKSLEKVVSNYSFALPSRSQLKAAAFNVPFTSIQAANIKGKLLESFYSEWSFKTINAVDGIIRAGFYNGETTASIVRQINGSSKAKFRDGLLERGNKDMTMLTRTAIQHSASQARKEVGIANKDIIRGIKIVATLDSSTSPECAMRDGKIYPVNQGPYPPYHVGCRTTFSFVLDNKYDFLDEGATRFSRGEDGVEKVPAKQDYYTWLRNQGSDFQDSVLGKSRGEVFRKGGLSVERFKELNYDKNFKQRTLAEMKKLEPLVFERVQK
jgi:SPP1 gp7 family putative phage head morphogenesis protein